MLIVDPGLTLAASVGAEWFRVRILKRMKALTGSKASKDFLVRLVDTGKVELVSLSSMKILEKQFFSLPSQVRILIAVTVSTVLLRPSGPTWTASRRAGRRRLCG